MVFPPLPNTISIPAVLAGNILENDDTSISILDNGFDGGIVLKTENTLAMVINNDQKVSINSEHFDSQFTINNDSPLTSTLRLSYLDSFYYDTRITANGNVLIEPTCDDLDLNPNLTTSIKKNFDILDHNGSTKGLKIGGTLITASATELNYVDVVVGIATANKALVFDSLKNILGINLLSANSISGVLTAGPQLNITEIDSLNIVSNLRLNGSLLTTTPEQLNSVSINTLGVAQASKALILNSSRNISNINSLVSNNLTGILTSGPQPNITSLGSLNSLTNNGKTIFNDTLRINASDGNLMILARDINNYSTVNINSFGDLIFSTTSNKIIIENGNDLNISGHNGSTNGLVLNGHLVLSSATQLNFNNVTTGTASAGKSLVLDNLKNILGINLLGANTLSGTLITGYQPNISSVNTLDILTNLKINGFLVNTTASQLNYNDVNVGVATANKSLVLDSDKNIGNIGNLIANNLYGTIQTTEQLLINKVNILTIANHNGSTSGLILGSTLVTATANQLNYNSISPGVAVANKSLVIDSDKNIYGINSFSSSILIGSLITPNQPGISSVDILNISNHDGATTGLSLNNSLVTATAIELNRVKVGTIGVAQSSRAVILNSVRSISNINVLNANSLSGIILTPDQPNISSVDVLNIINHNGTTTGLSLNNELVKANATQINYTIATPGIASVGKSLILNNSGNIIGINSLSATTLTGTIQTSLQPNINSVNVLNISNHNGTIGLSLGGILVSSTAYQLNYLNVTEGIAEVSKALVVNSLKNITGLNVISANTLTGTITTSLQPNINSVNILNIVNHNGATTGLSLNNELITASATQINRINTTAGNAQSTSALVVDIDRNIANINNLSASTLSGNILTAYQPNISSLNTLNISSHDGGTIGLKLNNILVIANANQLNYTVSQQGVASSGKALITDQFNSIININKLSATTLEANNLKLNGLLSSFNTGSILIKSYSSIDFTGRIIDTQLLSSIGLSNFQPNNIVNNYSSEIIGYILPQYSETYTFFINCRNKVRLYVNGNLILHSWTSITGFRTSSTIFLTADVWTPIYIQYQIESPDSSLLVVEWSSVSNGRTSIPTNKLAWDMNPPYHLIDGFSQNSLTIYNSSTAAVNFTKFTVDTGGDLTIDSSGNDIILGATDNFKIPSHNGSTKGLYLGGILVEPTASELNYLKTNIGLAAASKAMILNSSKSISGIESLSSNSLTCQNLTTGNFNISNLSLSGPLNNYNFGSLMIRQITGSDVSGRIVNVDIITDINLINYDPRELNSNYSLDIIGYILPQFTESYRFYITVNDRARVWINNVLLLNIWDTSSGIEYSSNTIPLVSNKWTPIYIQYQNISGSSSLEVKWSSNSLSKSFINSSFMSWDNNFTAIPRSLFCANSITLFNSSATLLLPQVSTISVDSNGELKLTSNTNTISTEINNSFNITTHNTTNTGLKLNNILITATANEINILSNLTEGEVIAEKLIIADVSKNLTGFNNLTATSFVGTIFTPNQPNITSLGTLTSTLNTTSDIVISSTNILRLLTNSTSSFIESSTSTTTDSAADLFIGNYNTTTLTSSRKFMIKSTGFVGIQTNTPNKTLSINGAGSTYSFRLINDNSIGGEINYTDMGVNNSGNLMIEPVGTSTNLLSNLILGKLNPSTIGVNSSGVMNISTTSGCVQIGDTTNTTLPLEIGSTSYSLGSDLFGYINSSGSVGIMSDGTTTSFSLRTTGSIIVGGSVNVISDRRLKSNIQNLNKDLCKTFIKNINPISFNYTNKNEKKTHYGFIAQDIYKLGLDSIISYIKDGRVNEYIDSDGFKSPAGYSLSIATEELIPILTINIKELYSENKNLKSEYSKLDFKNKQLESIINKLCSDMDTLKIDCYILKSNYEYIEFKTFIMYNFIIIILLYIYLKIYLL